MAFTAPTITVLGSLNVDHTFRVPRIPAPGETITAAGVATCHGGKGANQALAAARAGARVNFIGCVGEDEAGERYLDELHASGIDVSGVKRSSAAPTGSAFITVDDAGENTIIVNPGANHELDVAQLDRTSELIAAADALLLQLECPLSVVTAAARRVKERGVPVFLNPSPWSDELALDEFPVDVLIVNETEFRRLTGGVDDELAGSFARERGTTLVVTRGSGATSLHGADGTFVRGQPPRVEPVDTVGAGDTFAGSLAVARSGGDEWQAALDFANHAAALTTLKAGAQTAIPTRDAVLAFMAGRD